MIPTDWLRHERAEDGELVGYLVPATGGAYAPVTVFGSALGPAVDRDEAERRLDETGLAYLADRWLLDVDDHDAPITVEIVEADPSRVTVQSVDLGYARDHGTRLHVQVPAGGRLRKESRGR